eukprot:TRINITY_DN12939_c0_g1_i3.p1 TRINITY_DN12939_c0_g1~~TRINITY_DN12939_c0_g1_i3.p1  ORF type:complete len:1613 (-),score=294.70 TRINITY_DN12939_c0_g1_i3:280-4875(-)
MAAGGTAAEVAQAAADAAVQVALSDGLSVAEISVIASKAAKAVNVSQNITISAAAIATAKAALSTGQSPLDVGRAAADAARVAGATTNEAASVAAEAASMAALAKGQTPTEAGRMAADAAKQAGGSQVDAITIATGLAVRAALSIGKTPAETSKIAADVARTAGASTALAARLAGEASADAAISAGLSSADAGKIASQVAKTSGASQAEVAFGAAFAAAKVALSEQTEPMHVGRAAADAAIAAGMTKAEATRIAVSAATTVAVGANHTPTEVGRLASEAAKRAGASPSEATAVAVNAALKAALSYGASLTEASKVVAETANLTAASAESATHAVVAVTANAAISTGMSPASTAELVSELAHRLGASPASVAKLAASAAAQAAISTGQSLEDAGKHAASAALAAGASPHIAGKAAGEAVSDVAIAAGRSPAEVAQLASSAAMRAGASSVDVSRVAANAAARAALTQGKSPAEAARVAVDAAKESGASPALAAKIAGEVSANAAATANVPPAQAGEVAAEAARAAGASASDAARAAGDAAARIAMAAGGTAAEVAQVAADAASKAGASSAEIARVAADAAASAATSAGQSPAEIAQAAIDAATAAGASAEDARNAAVDAATTVAVELGRSPAEVGAAAAEAARLAGASPADIAKVAADAAVKTALSTGSPEADLEKIAQEAVQTSGVSASEAASIARDALTRAQEQHQKTLEENSNVSACPLAKTMSLPGEDRNAACQQSCPWQKIGASRACINACSDTDMVLVFSNNMSNRGCVRVNLSDPRVDLHFELDFRAPPDDFGTRLVGGLARALGEEPERFALAGLSEGSIFATLVVSSFAGEPSTHAQHVADRIRMMVSSRDQMLLRQDAIFETLIDALIGTWKEVYAFASSLDDDGNSSSMIALIIIFSVMITLLTVMIGCWMRNKYKRHVLPLDKREQTTLVKTSAWEQDCELGESSMCSPRFLKGNCLKSALRFQSPASCEQIAYPRIVLNDCYIRIARALERQENSSEKMSLIATRHVSQCILARCYTTATSSKVASTGLPECHTNEWRNGNTIISEANATMKPFALSGRNECEAINASVPHRASIASGLDERPFQNTSAQLESPVRTQMDVGDRVASPVLQLTSTAVDMTPLQCDSSNRLCLKSSSRKIDLSNDVNSVRYDDTSAQQCNLSLTNRNARMEYFDGGSPRPMSASRSLDADDEVVVLRSDDSSVLQCYSSLTNRSAEIQRTNEASSGVKLSVWDHDVGQEWVTFDFVLTAAPKFDSSASGCKADSEYSATTSSRPKTSMNDPRLSEELGNSGEADASVSRRNSSSVDSCSQEEYVDGANPHLNSCVWNPDFDKRNDCDAAASFQRSVSEESPETFNELLDALERGEHQESLSNSGLVEGAESQCRAADTPHLSTWNNEAESPRAAVSRKDVPARKLVTLQGSHYWLPLGCQQTCQNESQSPGKPDTRSFRLNLDEIEESLGLDLPPDSLKSAPRSASVDLDHAEEYLEKLEASKQRHSERICSYYRKCTPFDGLIPSAKLSK